MAHFAVLPTSPTVLGPCTAPFGLLPQLAGRVLVCRYERKRESLCRAIGSTGVGAHAVTYVAFGVSASRRL